jgi:hypothetical protein
MKAWYNTLTKRMEKLLMKSFRIYHLCLMMLKVIKSRREQWAGQVVGMGKQ